MAVFQTNRLLIRYPTTRDIDGVFEAAAHYRVVRFMFLPWPYERTDAEGFITLARAEKRRRVGLHFVIERKDDRAIVGSVALLNLDPRHRRAELGYWLGPRYWGHGYATEAVGGAVEYGFRRLALRRIHAITIAGNESSERVLMRAGFTDEGVSRDHLKHRGRWRDLRRWGLLRSEWSPMGHGADQ